MVIVQKVTSLAFSLHDGIARKETELTNNQKRYAVKVCPTPLEYFSYVLQFPTIMAGPAFFYNDYMEFIKGEHLLYQTREVSHQINFVRNLQIVITGTTKQQNENCYQGSIAYCTCFEKSLSINYLCTYFYNISTAISAG